MTRPSRQSRLPAARARARRPRGAELQRPPSEQRRAPRRPLPRRDAERRLAAARRARHQAVRRPPGPPRLDGGRRPDVPQPPRPSSAACQRRASHLWGRRPAWSGRATSPTAKRTKHPYSAQEHDSWAELLPVDALIVEWVAPVDLQVGEHSRLQRAFDRLFEASESARGGVSAERGEQAAPVDLVLDRNTDARPRIWVGW